MSVYLVERAALMDDDGLATEGDNTINRPLTTYTDTPPMRMDDHDNPQFRQLGLA